MNRSPVFLALAAALALPLPVNAAQPPPKPCSAAQYRQFDFWLGSWTVHNYADHKFEGTNTITREQGNCVLQEHWRGSDGGTGTSFNIFDSDTKQWHQTWVDSNGGLLVLNGSFRDGAMSLSGLMRDAGGRLVLHRITWTPRKDGSVRQRWIASRTGGKRWRTVFDGVYTRRK